VLIFLTNVRSTVIAAIAIPTSIVASFGLIWYMGFTLNSLTMLALTLAVGIVIECRWPSWAASSAGSCRASV
jgi:HAE1 family hydrophobic/amphiphilic exporter-1